MNWGLRIVVGLATFIVFIVGMVIYMLSKDTDSLEDRDYYEKSLVYDEVYGKKQNLVNDGAKPTVLVRSDTLVITFKKANNEGALKFKRPANDKLDQSLSFETNTEVYRLPVSGFQRGSWTLEIDWKGQGKNYISSHPVFL